MGALAKKKAGSTKIMGKPRSTIRGGAPDKKKKGMMPGGKKREHAMGLDPSRKKMRPSRDSVPEEEDETEHFEPEEVAEEAPQGLLTDSSDDDDLDDAKELSLDKEQDQSDGSGSEEDDELLSDDEDEPTTYANIEKKSAALAAAADEEDEQMNDDDAAESDDDIQVNAEEAENMFVGDVAEVKEVDFLVGMP